MAGIDIQDDKISVSQDKESAVYILSVNSQPVLMARADVMDGHFLYQRKGLDAKIYPDFNKLDAPTVYAVLADYYDAMNEVKINSQTELVLPKSQS